MWRVIDCLRYEHDLRFVALAVLLCVLGSVSTVIVARRTADSGRFGPWVVLLGICAGAMVWSTHFISMLAYRLGLPVSYDATLSILSFAVGVIGMGAGLALALRGPKPSRDRWLGGVVVGAAVAVLHYVGMAALRFEGHITYDLVLVHVSVLLSCGFGALATRVLTGPWGRGAMIGSVALLVAMTASLHYTGMGAVNLHLGLSSTGPIDGLSRSELAVEVAIAAVIVLAAGLVGALVDQRLSARLQAEAERFRAFSDGTFEGLVVHSDGLLIDTNREARKLLGLDTEESAVALESLIGVDAWSVLRRWADSGKGQAIELELKRRDGTHLSAEVRLRPLQLADGRRGEMIAVRDIGERKASEAQIAHLALHDALTDLPNRRFFGELATKAIAHARRGDDAFALMLLDLDDFKSVNEMYGQDAGDELLQAVSERARIVLREGDVLARMGGDEFALLVHSAADAPDAMAVCERLLTALRDPIGSSSASPDGRASIGVAFYPQDGDSLTELLRNADTAMYRAKKDGRSSYRFFEAQMDEALATRRRLEHRLRLAVDNDSLQVYYQPLVDARSLKPLGFEALLRWTDDELGPVSPAEFVPIAEEAGLIVPIGEQVLRKACADAASWPGSLKVAVNLSPVQFRGEGLLEVVSGALLASGLAGHRLDLEVTESLLIDDASQVGQLLASLRDAGVGVALDDFGTGYSSLGYLQSFPFDKLKIDRVFVSDLENSERNVGIVRAVIALGKTLGMRVVAEGVETDGQVQTLRTLACDELQGYLLSRPMPAGDVLAYLASAAAIADSAQDASPVDCGAPAPA